MNKNSQRAGQNALRKQSDFALLDATNRAHNDRDFIALRGALASGNLRQAGNLLEILTRRETSNPIYHYFAGELEAKKGNMDHAAVCYRRCLSIAPNFIGAVFGLARCEGHVGNLEQAEQLLEKTLALDLLNVPARLLRASTANRTGKQELAIAITQGLINENPGNFGAWLELGHSQRFSGNKTAAIAAYREVIGRAPKMPDPWYYLSDLKTYKFSDDELETMAELERSNQYPEPGRTMIQFALANTYFDRGDYEKAHHHYEVGNNWRTPIAETRLKVFNDWADKCIAELKTSNAPVRKTDRPMPIFIVGMPRVGSTLVEQILAGHSQIEACDEMPHMDLMTHRVRQSETDLSKIDRKAFAKEYLDRTAYHRKTNKRWFTDKLPANYRNTAFIKAVLPEARIIDVRRHPLASTVAIFRQHFTHNLAELGGSLAQVAATRLDYAKMMDRFDAALPGAVLRVHYEDLIEDVETQTHRMLDFIGLPFEEECLKWYESKAAIRTPSSEQVRQPIYRSALEEWQHFDPWLAEARIILSDEIAKYGT